MRIEMPKEGRDKKYLKNHHHHMPVPYFIYADFESIQVPKSGLKGRKTEITDEHEACGFRYQLERYDGESNEPLIYRGEDTVEVFFKSLRLRSFKYK